MHCREVLKDDQKWASTLPNKRQRCDSESDSFPPNAADLGTNDDSSPNQSRPLGRKAAKELLKGKGKQDGQSTSPIMSKEFWERKMKLDEENAVRRDQTLL